MRLKILKTYPAFAAAFLFGCAAHWEMTEGNTLDLPGKKTAEISRKWMALDNDNELFLSRHAPSLELISVSRRKIENAFKYTSLKLDTSMLIHEVAQIAVREIRSIPGVHDLQILSQSTAEVCGAEAFRVNLSFIPADGVPKKALIYGFIKGDYYHELAYSAAKRHYYQSSLSDFEDLVRSYRAR